MNKKIYFTSDWHVGHEKVIEYSQRPFKDIHHMSTVLVNNYNSTVGNNDICYFLGDIGMCRGEYLENTLKRLNSSTKVLIVGNHDNKGQQFWYKCGFSAVMFSSSLKIARNTVTMSHCPLYGVYREDTSKMRGCDGTENWHGEEKNYRKGFSLPDFGQFHLHGHIHSPNKGQSRKIEGRQYDIGVDANKYRPVSSSVIESWVTKYGK